MWMSSYTPITRAVRELTDTDTTSDIVSQREFVLIRDDSSSARSRTSSHQASIDTDDADGPSKEAAEEHVHVCKIRALQLGLENLKEQALENNVDVPEQMLRLGYVDAEGTPSNEALLKDCPQFDLTCDPAELGELGPGYPLYFAFIKYLIALLFLYTIILSPMIWENYQAYVDDPEGIMTWNKLVLKDEQALCRRCTGNVGALGPYWGPAPTVSTDKPKSGKKYEPVGTRKDYGARCSPWDIDDCALWQTFPGVTVGGWCCMSWCYVDKNCPVAEASSAMEGLYYAYTACADDPHLMKTCPWSNESAAEEFNGQPINDDRVYEMVSPWFLTPGNLGVDKETGYGRSTSMTPVICYVLVLVVTLAMVMAAHHLNRQITQTADDVATHPHDFAILVEGLPEDADSEREISEFFEKYALGPRDPPTAADSSSSDSDTETQNGEESTVEIVSVVICWKSGDLSKIMSEREELHKEKLYLLNHGIKPQDEKWTKHIEKEQKLVTEIEDWVEEDLELTNSGLAVVVFRNQKHQEAVVERWQPTFWQRVMNSWSCCKHSARRKLPKFRGAYRLKISKAPNPGDFQWQNVTVTRCQRLCLYALSFIVLLALLTCGFFLILFLKREQERTVTQHVDENTGAIVFEHNILYSLLVPAVVAVVNAALVAIAPILSKRELHKTISHEMASTLAKLTICMSINGGLIVFAANCLQGISEAKDLVFHEEGSGGTRVMESARSSGVSPKQWYQKGGLVSDVFFMLIAAGLGPCIVALVDFKRLKGLCRACCINVNTTNMTKEEYNELHEPAEPEIDRWMATCLKMFILSVLYSPLFPLGPIISGICLSIYYWSTKYAILRIKKRPSIILGTKLAREGLRSVQLSVSFVLPITALLCLSASATEAFGQSLAFYFEMLFLAAFVFWLIQTPFQKLRQDKQNNEKEEKLADLVDYYEAQHTWPTDWKYRKSHFLYRALPVELNPETLNPGTEIHDLADAIRKHFADALEKKMEMDERPDRDLAAYLVF